MKRPCVGRVATVQIAELRVNQKPSTAISTRRTRLLRGERQIQELSVGGGCSARSLRSRYLHTTPPIVSLLAGSPAELNCVMPNLEFAGIAMLPLKVHDVAGPVIVQLAAVFENVKPNAPAAVTTV